MGRRKIKPHKCLPKRKYTKSNNKLIEKEIKVEDCQVITIKQEREDESFDVKQQTNDFKVNVIKAEYDDDIENIISRSVVIPKNVVRITESDEIQEKMCKKRKSDFMAESIKHSADKSIMEYMEFIENVNKRNDELLVKIIENTIRNKELTGVTENIICRNAEIMENIYQNAEFVTNTEKIINTNVELARVTGNPDFIDNSANRTDKIEAATNSESNNYISEYVKFMENIEDKRRPGSPKNKRRRTFGSIESVVVTGNAGSGSLEFVGVPYGAQKYFFIEAASCRICLKKFYSYWCLHKHLETSPNCFYGMMNIIQPKTTENEPESLIVEPDIICYENKF